MSIKEEIQRYFALVMGNRTRSEIKHVAESLGYPIFDHVLKLTLFGNRDKSWQSDIVDWLLQIHRLFLDNKGNKRLSPKNYYDELFFDTNSWKDVYKHKIETLEQKTELKSRYTADQWVVMYKLHDELYQFISNELSKPKMDLDGIKERLVALTKI